MFTKRRRKKSEWEGVWEENWARSSTPSFPSTRNIDAFSQMATQGRRDEEGKDPTSSQNWLRDLFGGGGGTGITGGTSSGSGGMTSSSAGMGAGFGGGEGQAFGYGVGSDTGFGAGLGSGGVESAGSSGSSAVGPLAIFLAAVAGQHALSGDTNRETEGQETSDLFQGSVGTEPWWAWLKQQAGWEDMTAGEKFDAALKNEDWGLALERLPSTLHYWFNPAQTSGYEVIKEQWGGDWAKAIFPLEGFFGDSEWVEDLLNWESGNRE